MDGPRDCPTEWSKSDREGEILYYTPYEQNLKRDDRNELLFIKLKETHRLREQTYGCQKRDKIEGRDSYGIWDRHSAQQYMAALMWEAFGGEWMHVYIYGRVPFAIHLKLSQHG